MSTVTLLLQTTSITTSFLAAGGIASITLFDVPILQSQPASRSLPSTRWLFSRGSHVFPAAAAVSGLGFGTLGLLSYSSSSSYSSAAAEKTVEIGGYVAAALLCVAIAPWTFRVMVPNNFELIRMNAERGGARSSAAAAAHHAGGQGGEKKKMKERSANDSVRGVGEGPEFTDLSGPQGSTPEETTEAEDERVREMLGVFGRQNMARAVLMALGGVVGLVTALSLA